MTTTKKPKKPKRLLPPAGVGEEDRDTGPEWTSVEISKDQYQLPTPLQPQQQQQPGPQAARQPGGEVDVAGVPPAGPRDDKGRGRVGVGMGGWGWARGARLPPRPRGGEGGTGDAGDDKGTPPPPLALSLLEF
jgi:hypothetical protein